MNLQNDQTKQRLQQQQGQYRGSKETLLPPSNLTMIAPIYPRTTSLG